MTFLNDFWKKYKPPVTNKDWKDAMTDETLTADEAPHELRFSNPKQLLSQEPAASKSTHTPNHTSICCPNCQSTHLKQVVQLISPLSYKHHYRCLDCDTEFNDQSGTAFEKPLPPLNVWMQCWYLMGCTESLSYIANTLNLDLGLIEFMVRQLQKTFNATKPVIHLLDFEEWDKNTSEMQKQLKEDLIKHYEALNANIATTPWDTSEFRRQQNLRRTLNASTAPPSPTLPPSKGKRF